MKATKRALGLALILILFSVTPLLAYDCSETTQLAIPDSRGVVVGDHLKYIGDPNTCSNLQLPQGAGCITPDCQKFTPCTSCSSCGLSIWILGADSNFWLNTGRNNTTWEVTAVTEWTGDTSWNCVTICRCN